MESKKQAKNYSNMHTPEAKLRNKVALFNKYSTVCSEVKFVKRGDGAMVQNCKIDDGICNYKRCPLKRFSLKKDAK